MSRFIGPIDSVQLAPDPVREEAHAEIERLRAPFERHLARAVRAAMREQEREILALFDTLTKLG